jgi:hypothetical protein
MGKDASRALGARELAGSIVNARTFVRKLTAGSMEPVAAAASEGAPELPHFGRVGYLAVTADEIVIVATKNAALWTRIGDRVLARARRSAITAVELDAGLLSHLTIEFDNEVSWEFDIPRLNRGTTEGVVRELGGSV